MIITSIAPGKEYQQQIIDSWVKTGHKIVSLNHPSEISQLEIDNVEFIPIINTGFKIFGKHYIPLTEFINHIKTEGSGLILNADIILKGLPTFDKNPVVFNRYDFTGKQEPVFFESGFDGFYLTKEHCELLKPTKLCLGQCFWDYWLPFSLILKQVKLSTPQKPYLYHERHPVQYSNNMWRKTAEIFKREMGMSGTHIQISNRVHSIILKNLIQI